ncbi:MAG: DUF4250 domain-containing protein [Lachnospiraceae bacterium]|nr:DUF4250 domain-containing protein [Lachnospiraceae bacterium]
MNQIPNDPVLLLSVVNTALRDRYPTLERFCAANMITEDVIKEKLKAIDYTYDPDENQFV